MLVRGGAIIRPLHDAGLIDEYIVTIIPVVLGKGIELFPDIEKELRLVLKDSKSYPDGLVTVHYVNNQTN